MTRAYPISTADQAPSTRTARMGNSIAKAWRGYWQRRAKRATVELLHSLDDRTLHDIGVEPERDPVARLRQARRPYALLRGVLAAVAREQVTGILATWGVGRGIGLRQYSGKQEPNRSPRCPNRPIPCSPCPRL